MHSVSIEQLFPIANNFLDNWSSFVPRSRPIDEFLRSYKGLILLQVKSFIIFDFRGKVQFVVVLIAGLHDALTDVQDLLQGLAPHACDAVGRLISQRVYEGVVIVMYAAISCRTLGDLVGELSETGLTRHFHGLHKLIRAEKRLIFGCLQELHLIADPVIEKIKYHGPYGLEIIGLELIVLS